jgi:hypothetical protein
MAKNTNNRISIKWVRDKAKAAYQKKSNCYICDTTEDLELHHLHSLTILLNTWAARKKYDLSTDEAVLAHRDEFIAEHKVEIYDLVYTLCNKHHVMLHGVYGKAPPPDSADKQKRWIEKQKAKFQDADILEPSPSYTGFISSGTFSNLITNISSDFASFYKKESYGMV